MSLGLDISPQSSEELSSILAYYENGKVTLDKWQHDYCLASIFNAGLESQRRRSRGFNDSAYSIVSRKALSEVPCGNEVNHSTHPCEPGTHVFTNSWSSRNSIIEEVPSTPSPITPLEVLTPASYELSQSTTLSSESKGISRGSQALVEFNPVAEIVDHIETNGIRFNLLTSTKQHDGGANILPRKKSREEGIAGCLLNTSFESKDNHNTTRYPILSTEYWYRKNDIAKKEPWPKKQLEDIHRREMAMKKEEKVEKQKQVQKKIGSHHMLSISTLKSKFRRSGSTRT